MALNDTFLRKQKVTSNRKYDRDGLYIQATNNGAKYRYWRVKYRRPSDKKEDVLAIGKYPEVSLSEARKKTLEAKILLSKGIDPKVQKKAASVAASAASNRIFENVALEVIHNQDLSESSRSKKLSRFRNYVFPLIGKKPLDSISTPDLTAILRNLVLDKKLETARKVKRELDQVLTHATQAGYVTTNNAQNLKGLIPPSRVNHKPAITDPKRFGVLLNKIDSYDENSIVGTALRLAPLVFQRPGELVTMEWDEVSIDKAIWEIPPEKKKERKHLTGPHIVPLSTQAIDIIESLRLVTGNQKYVFNSLQSPNKHISTDSMVKALRTVGVNTKNEQSVHGFRASARTMLEEQLKIPYTIIELQLSHSVPDAHGRAYNRTKFLDERAKMMQEWADYLNGLKDKKPLT